MRRALSGYCKQRMRIRQGRRATTCSSAVFAWATPDGNLLRTTCRENDCRRRCRRSPVSRLLNAFTYQATPCRYRLWSACERPFSDPSLFHKNDWKGGGCRMSAFSASSLEPDRPLTAPIETEIGFRSIGNAAAFGLRHCQHRLIVAQVLRERETPIHSSNAQCLPLTTRLQH